jgi:hypothetical protein
LYFCFNFAILLQYWYVCCFHLYIFLFILLILMVLFSFSHERKTLIQSINDRFLFLLLSSFLFFGRFF